jgi:hypothetical protein
MDFFQEKLVAVMELSCKQASIAMTMAVKVLVDRPIADEAFIPDSVGKLDRPVVKDSEAKWSRSWNLCGGRMRQCSSLSLFRCSLPLWTMRGLALRRLVAVLPDLLIRALCVKSWLNA